MPEGHTIHRLAADHARWFAGQRPAISSPQGRFSGASVVDGQRLDGVEAYGKHLFYAFGANVVHVHLGLFGRFHRHPVPPPAPRETVRMRLVGDDVALDLIGPTACELVTPADRDAIIDRLGPDPLRADADPNRALAALGRKRIGIGRALLDQSVLAGVGNVYRAEVLHVEGLHPLVAAASVTPAQWQRMWDRLAGWMTVAVDTQRIVTVADEDAEPDDDAKHRVTYVYRREHCRTCGTPVRRWDLAGRWAYACESCQPPP